jgi:hypothetical protein
MPTLLRKVEVAMDWAWSALFRPNIVQLHMSRTADASSVQLVSKSQTIIEV